jgi:hypothetical protein
MELILWLPQTVTTKALKSFLSRYPVFTPSNILHCESFIRSHKSNYAFYHQQLCIILSGKWSVRKYLSLSSLCFFHCSIITSETSTRENNKKLRSFLHVLTIITSIDSTCSDVLENRSFTSQIIGLINHHLHWDLPTRQSALLFLGCLVDKNPRILNPEQSSDIFTSILSNTPSNDVLIGSELVWFASTNNYRYLFQMQ